MPCEAWAYRNSGWDLVDAFHEKKIILEKVKEKDLPEEMRKMTIEEKRSFILSKTTARGKIKKQIQKLNEARKKYVAEKRKEQAKKEENTFDSAVIKSVNRMAKRKGFSSKVL